MAIDFPSPPPAPRPLPAPVAEEPPRLTARTLEGLEWVLARELEGAGARDLRIGRRTIEFSAAPGAERETLYRAVLESRTAIRILEPLGRFRVDAPEALYRAMQEVDWTEQLKVSDTLRVDAAIHDTFTTHSLYAAQVVKDAVVDQLRTPSGKRPGVQLRGATLRLALHLVGDVATIFRDAAGRSLHQRGWRMGEVEAPLSEVLAAGILALAGWWRPGAPADAAAAGEPVLDPMCGSGTLVIEAATIAAGMAPGLWRARRRAHGFFRFRDCDRPLADRLVADLEARVGPPRGGFAASDLDPRAVAAAEACAAAAGVAAAVTIGQRHFEEVRPQGEPGLVVTNPPYGERLPLPRAGALFRRLGDWLVAQCGGWRAAILAADTPAAGHLGLRPTHRVPLMNGPIACRLLEVEIRPRHGTPDAASPGVPRLAPGASWEGERAATVARPLTDATGCEPDRRGAAASRDRAEDSEPMAPRHQRGNSDRPGADNSTRAAASRDRAEDSEPMAPRHQRGNSDRPGADGAIDPIPSAVGSAATPAAGSPSGSSTWRSGPAGRGSRRFASTTATSPRCRW